MELTKIRGINEKRKEEFNKIDIFDTADLMRFFPRNYLDLREKQPLKYAYHNDIVLTTGKVLSVPTTRYYKRGGIVKITCEQEGYVFSVIWFNQPYVASKLKVGEEYLFHGRVPFSFYFRGLVFRLFLGCVFLSCLSLGGNFREELCNMRAVLHAVILHEMQLGRDPQIQRDRKMMAQHTRALFEPDQRLLEIPHAGIIHGGDLQIGRNRCFRDADEIVDNARLTHVAQGNVELLCHGIVDPTASIL